MAKAVQQQTEAFTEEAMSAKSFEEYKQYQKQQDSLENEAKDGEIQTNKRFSTYKSWYSNCLAQKRYRDKKKQQNEGLKQQLERVKKEAQDSKDLKEENKNLKQQFNEQSQKLGELQQSYESLKKKQQQQQNKIATKDQAALQLQKCHILYQSVLNLNVNQGTNPLQFQLAIAELLVEQFESIRISVKNNQLDKIRFNNDIHLEQLGLTEFQKGQIQATYGYYKDNLMESKNNQSFLQAFATQLQIHTQKVAHQVPTLQAIISSEHEIYDMFEGFKDIYKKQFDRELNFIQEFSQKFVLGYLQPQQTLNLLHQSYPYFIDYISVANTIIGIDQQQNSASILNQFDVQSFPQGQNNSKQNLQHYQSNGVVQGSVGNQNTSSSNQQQSRETSKNNISPLSLNFQDSKIRNQSFQENQGQVLLNNNQVNQLQGQPNGLLHSNSLLQLQQQMQLAQNAQVYIIQGFPSQMQQPLINGNINNQQSSLQVLPLKQGSISGQNSYQKQVQKRRESLDNSVHAHHASESTENQTMEQQSSRQQQQPEVQVENQGIDDGEQNNIEQLERAHSSLFDGALDLDQDPWLNEFLQDQMNDLQTPDLEKEPLLAGGGDKGGFGKGKGLLGESVSQYNMLQTSTPTKRQRMD